MTTPPVTPAVALEQARGRVLDRLAAEATERARHPSGAARSGDPLDGYVHLARARHHQMLVVAGAESVPQPVLAAIRGHYPIRGGCEGCGDGMVTLWPCPWIMRVALERPVRFDLGEGLPMRYDTEEK